MAGKKRRRSKSNRPKDRRRTEIETKIWPSYKGRERLDQQIISDVRMEGRKLKIYIIY